MTTLSVIIITKNEAKNISRCLESVKWANEIIVLDSGSTDETVTLCQKYTSLVFNTDWPGFGPQKNRALAKVSCEWVLSLDADEWLPEPLQHEIAEMVAHNNKTITYSIRRRSFYCGKLIKHGDWRNDEVLRLFPKDKATFSHDQVHERLITQNKATRLKNYLMHNSFPSMDNVLTKMNLYSSLSAQQKFSQGKQSSVSKAFLHGVWTFIKGYFLRAGFLDGTAGLLLAISNAQGSFYRYVKLAELQRQAK